MCSLETFKIDLKALKEDLTVLKFSLNDDYFKAIDAPEVRQGTLCSTLSIRKADGFFELDFHTEGTIRIPCDLCLEDMEQAIQTENRLIAKLGAENSEEDDLLIVAEDEGILDVSWLIYEMIVLNIPMRHAHEEGKCNASMMEKLHEYMADGRDSQTEKVTDPRWAKLKELRVEN